MIDINSDNEDRISWIEIEEKLFPSRELIYTLEESQFKALTFLIPILMNSKKAHVSYGVISWDYNDNVSIELDVLDTLRRNRAIKSEARENFNHLSVRVGNKNQPNRAKISTCITTEKENQSIPILDACVSFALMAEDGFSNQLPETLQKSIYEIQLSEEAYKRKKELDSLLFIRRRQMEQLRQQIELEEERLFEISSQIEEQRIRDLSWEELLHEHENTPESQNKLERFSRKLRCELIGIPAV